MTATAPLTRTDDQRLDALEKANRIRVARARLKRDLTAGTVDARLLLADPPEWAHTMRTLDLLRALPHFGFVKARRMLFRCRIAESKTLAGLSDRQRRELVAALGR